MEKSSGGLFSNLLLSKTPYSWRILDAIADMNPKYEDFKELSIRKDERLAQQSVVLPQIPGSNDDMPLLSVINKDYQQYMYAGIDNDKIRRLQDYRRMAAFAEVADAIDEICDECIVKDEDDDIVQFEFRKQVEKPIRKEILTEWEKFLSRTFDLEHNGWELYRQFLIDGEMYFENIISQNKPEYGILGTLNVPTELINPIYDNVQNGVIKGFLLRRPVVDDKVLPQPYQQSNKKEETILLDKNQITYIHSGIWNEDRSVRLPYIENARRAYKQLSLIEDSIIIYRLVRAPERLVFTVDVGNMSTPQAESYLKRMMSQYWTRKSYDRHGKTTTHVYDPQSMLDSYWFTKRKGNQGTDVKTLPAGQNLGQLDDLHYFQRKLYKSLKVPTNRLNSEDTFKDGAEITREELRFARFIMRLQRQFALGIRECFMVHLKLRGLWERYEIKETDIHVYFNVPSHFMAMREQQLLDIKWNNYNNFSGNEVVAHSYAQRYYLHWNDDQMAENREWLRKDAELLWEIEQIKANGPDFRDQMSDMAQAAADAGMGGSAMGGGMPPEFGPAPDIGAEEGDEGEEGTETPAEAGESAAETDNKVPEPAV
jgi:hypothetical protein